MDLVFDRVNKRYEHREALIDLSFEMHSGEMAFLTGHSGAGKSTLLRLLLLLDRASSGEVSVGGRPLSNVKESRVAKYRQDFGVVFQDHKLLADRSGNLDPQLSAEIMGLFSAFNSVGVTVIVASHDLALISRMSQRILTLDRGRLITLGTGSRGINE